MILAGDVGGTHARLGLFELQGPTLRQVVERTFPSRDHGSLDEIVATFVTRERGSVEHACFGIAGPIRGDHVEATNLPWSVDAGSLKAQLGGATVTLINDLEAHAYGLATLGPGDLAVLQAGRPEPRGNLAVVSAGTGLGEAGLVWDGHRYRPFATEGGHADFAPGDDLQIDLLRFLAVQLGHVSVERVLSGPGLHNVYQFLRDTKRGEEPAWLAEEIRTGDPPAVIAQAALARRSPLCEQALDLFVAIYGAEAGNFALKVLATGGVYVGGGIAPKVLEKLRSPGFLAAFRAKGRLAPLMEAMPVRVILNDQAALAGAARCAALRASLIE